MVREHGFEEALVAHLPRFFILLFVPEVKDAALIGGISDSKPVFGRVADPRYSALQRQLKSRHVVGPVLALQHIFALFGARTIEEKDLIETSEDIKLLGLRIFPY